MHPDRRCRWIALVLVAPLLLGACGQDEPEGAEPLALSSYGDEVTLDDGTEVRVAVRDDQEIVVQWRAEGAGWTEPAAVYRETDHWIHDDVTLTAAGDTLAINQDYWVEEELQDDFPPDHSVQVICRDLTCTEGQRTTGDFLTSTRFTPDGEHSLFRTDDSAAVLWSAEEGERQVPLEGVGADDDLALLDDGSLVAARTESVGEECLLRLRAAEGGGGQFGPVAEWGPYPGGPELADGTVLCSLYEVEPAEDAVTVFLDEYDDAGVTFRRIGEAWMVD
jgi:hypothetical protein